MLVRSCPHQVIKEYEDVVPTMQHSNDQQEYHRKVKVTSNTRCLLIFCRHVLPVPDSSV